MSRTYIPKTYNKHKRVASKPKAINRIILFLKFLIFVIIIGGIGYLLYSPVLNIMNFEIKVENENLKTEINSKTKDIVSAQTHWWYNNQNIFLLRSDKLEKDLLQGFPQIKSISIKRDLLNRVINLDIVFRNPAFYYCDNGLCYNISEEGVNMGINQSLDSNLVEIKNVSSKKAGEYVFSAREINWLKSILQEYNKIDTIKIKSIDIQQKSGNDIISILVYTEKGYYIMLDLDTDIIYQSQALKQAFISQIPPEKRDLLEYIDLRIKDRIYYKFK
jgi:cell division septal protein FtsQ